MKRLRVERWSGQLFTQRATPCCRRQQLQPASIPFQSIRTQSSSAASDVIYEDGEEFGNEPVFEEADINSTYPSPPPEAALRSPKLAALHARLSLPKKVPLQTVARTLVDPTADSNRHFNNASLAQIGSMVLSYHVSEFLLCTYPRLPMTVLFAATYAYNGDKTLELIAREWGVDTAAAPGSEVDPGLLQFEKTAPGEKINNTQGGAIRPDKKSGFRRGMSSRVVYDDEFGDVIPKDGVVLAKSTTEFAYAGFVKAIIGALHVHAGREAAKTFVKRHFLSRHLDIGSLFAFKEPLRELARLCARENFDDPIARILSETGRFSRSPVFVVGIFSGEDKLGEGAGASLYEARLRASVNSLKSWYLYSPGNDMPVPSDMEGKSNQDWKPVHIDMGEIIH